MSGYQGNAMGEGHPARTVLGPVKGHVTSVKCIHHPDSDPNDVRDDMARRVHREDDAGALTGPIGRKPPSGVDPFYRATGPGFVAWRIMDTGRPGLRLSSDGRPRSSRPHLP